MNPPGDTAHFFFPHLANAAPAAPLAQVSKAQFAVALADFSAAYPPNAPVSDPKQFVAAFRHLLDHLDALSENLSLKQTTMLFRTLSAPPALHYLLFLLSDISVTSTQASKDVRKVYRYPQLVSAILANGNSDIRDAFLSDSRLVHQLLSFLDSDVALHTSATQMLPHQPSKMSFARDNSVVVVNVVQIIVSYMDTNPDAMIRVFEYRSTWIPALVNLLHVGAIPKLLESIIPDSTVHQLSTYDHAHGSLSPTLLSPLNILANSSVFHLLADAFIRAAQTVLTYYTSTPGSSLSSLASTTSDLSTGTSMHPREKQSHAVPKTSTSPPRHEKEVHLAQQLACNIADTYDALVSKVVRAIRINGDLPACQYLNVFGNPGTAETVAQILRAATQLFRGTAFEKSALLSSALTLTLRMLRVLQHDRERRIPSVLGQPPQLSTEALQICLKPVLSELMSLLIDLVSAPPPIEGPPAYPTIRLHILDLFVEVCRVASADMMHFIHSLRFGEVAMKLIGMFPRNSLMHHVVCRAVEDGLISRYATKESAYHWLVRTSLPQKLIELWHSFDGDTRWWLPRESQESPFLSAVVHMSCCVHHWLAMEGLSEQDASRSEDFWGGVNPCEKRAFPTLLAADVQDGFMRFWADSIQHIMTDETKMPFGPKLKRKAVRGGISLGFSPGGASGGTGARTRWSGALPNFTSCTHGTSRTNNPSPWDGGAEDGKIGGTVWAHLVRSDSAHRFGYVEKERPLRSRFDDVFMDGGGDEDFGHGGSLASLLGGGVGGFG